MNKEMILSYIRSLLATAVAATFAVSQSVGKLPWEFNANDWYGIANAIWVSVIPVAIRYLNPKDSAFGVVKSEDTAGN